MMIWVLGRMIIDYDFVGGIILVRLVLFIMFMCSGVVMLGVVLVVVFVLLYVVLILSRYIVVVICFIDLVIVFVLCDDEFVIVCDGTVVRVYCWCEGCVYVKSDMGKCMDRVVYELYYWLGI